MAERYILLIEDNPDDVVLIRRSLQRNKIANDLVVLTDGQEALDFFEYEIDERGLPALVLLDLKLPKVSGLDVLAQLRQDERMRLQPVVVLTSSREESDIVEAYQNGANSYVRKPIEFGELVEAVRVLGLYWLLVNETVPASQLAAGPE